MDRFVQLFIRASLVWLVIGVLIGVSMAFAPELIVIRRAHVHANALGFITMMIFGVAYHVLPRFIGQPLWSQKLPTWNWWFSNVGLALLVIGWIVFALAAPAWLPRVLTSVGAASSAVGALLFALTIWRTLDRANTPIIQLRKVA